MRNEIAAIILKLKAVEEKVEASLERAEEANSAVRQDRLEAELQSIQDAIDALDEID